MKTLTLISLLINIIAILALTIGLFGNIRQSFDPKKKATVGLFIGISMYLYIILLLITGLFGIINHHYYLAILLIFAIIPFILGHYSSFNKLRLYTIYQIISFIISSTLLIYVYFVL